MATQSSILAWRIPWTEEPGRLYSPQSPRAWVSTRIDIHTLIQSISFLKKSPLENWTATLLVAAYHSIIQMQYNLTYPLLMDISDASQQQCSNRQSRKGTLEIILTFFQNLIFLPLLTYFWLCWPLLLHGLFSRLSKQRLLPNFSLWASHCGGFSCFRT